MISGLAKIYILIEVYEECVQVKKHNNRSNKDARRKSRDTLEVISSNVCGPIQVDSIGGKKSLISVYNYGHTLSKGKMM